MEDAELAQGRARGGIYNSIDSKSKCIMLDETRSTALAQFIGLFVKGRKDGPSPCLHGSSLVETIPGRSHLALDIWGHKAPRRVFQDHSTDPERARHLNSSLDSNRLNDVKLSCALSKQACPGPPVERLE